VILWHVAWQTRFPAEYLGPLGPVVGSGWAGVDLFFALSGFLITKLALDEERTSGRALDLREFYARRALRILPAFYLVLFANLLLLGPLGSFGSLHGTGRGGPLEYLSLGTYWSNYYYNYIRPVAPNEARATYLYWSLCVEEHFYLLWPFFLWRVRRLRSRAAVGGLLCVGFIGLRWWALRGVDTFDAVHTASHYRFDSILWGALGAFALEFESLRRAHLYRRILLLCLAFLLPQALRFAITGPAQGALRLTVLALFGAALATEVVLVPEGLIASILAFRPLAAAGRISYGMYLVHFQVIDVVTPPIVGFYRYASFPAFVVVACATLLATYCVAWSMYMLFERPFLRLKARFTPRRIPLTLAPGESGGSPLPAV
jgi:peptidoglycan/LPS O-acetylase OafA/YrhL